MLKNPIHGIIQGSPYCTVERGENNDVDKIYNKLEQTASDWQKSASKYVKDKIKPDSRDKIKKVY